MKNSDVRTLAYVMRRTNFGEADRILNLITPEGKISAIAKSVRREKSKLAGAVEMFSLIDVNVHFGKNELGVVTGARMLKHHGAILKDLTRMELAGLVLRKVNGLAESSDSAEYFKIVDAVFRALGAGEDLAVVEAWFWLNLMGAAGEQINLYRDAAGEKLVEGERYSWDFNEMALVRRSDGEVDTETIKILRLIVTTDLAVVLRVKGVAERMGVILRIAKAAAKN